jgi:hypothetical protein
MHLTSSWRLHLDTAIPIPACVSVLSSQHPSEQAVS